MKNFEVVKLNKDINKTLVSGIYGIVLEKRKDVSLVLFLNFLNFGDYCVREVGNVALEYVREVPEDVSSEFKNIVKDFDVDKKEFITTDLKQFDNVMLINEKPNYLHEGVKKGNVGMINSDYAILGKWEVIFPKENGDVCAVISESDLKKV